MCFSPLGLPAGFGNRRRQSLRDVFHRIVKRAGDWPADALLIAGDLFEGDRVSRDTVQFLAAEFRNIAHVPIFISPGNHDPFTAASPYATEAWPKNVNIFRRPVWESATAHGGALTVHGFGFDGPDISNNPFGKLALPESRPGIHIGVAHGSERGHQPPEKKSYAAFDAKEAAVNGLRYLALGHFHGATPIEGEYSTTMWYSGSPEGHSLRETGMHHYLEIEIDDRGVDVTAVPSSRVIYTVRRLMCDEFESAQDVIDAIRAIAREEEARQVARVVLAGGLDPAIHSELGLIYDAAALEFEHLYLLDRTAPLEDFDALAKDDTSLGSFVRRLNGEIVACAEEGQRQKLVRAREIGVAAFRRREMEIRGLERG
jgi:DNA repair exonuclease SbcCD nuclease subunit